MRHRSINVWFLLKILARPEILGTVSNPHTRIRWWRPPWFPSQHITEQVGCFSVDISFDYRDFGCNTRLCHTSLRTRSSHMCPGTSSSLDNSSTALWKAWAGDVVYSLSLQIPYPLNREGEKREKSLLKETSHQEIQHRQMLQMQRFMTNGLRQAIADRGCRTARVRGGLASVQISSVFW